MAANPCPWHLPAILAAGLVLAGCAAAIGPLPGGNYSGNYSGNYHYAIGQPHYTVAPYQINGVWYYPRIDYAYDATGTASWYGPGFDRRPTADGEIYDMNELSAAHKTLPLPSVVEVSNLQNGRALRLRVNDRGPFIGDRLIDVSRRAAQLLGFERSGTAPVRVRILKDESIQVAQAAMLGEFGPVGIAAAAAAPAAVRSEMAAAAPPLLGRTPAPVVAPSPRPTQFAAAVAAPPPPLLRTRQVAVAQPAPAPRTRRLIAPSLPRPTQFAAAAALPPRTRPPAALPPGRTRLAALPTRPIAASAAVPAAPRRTPARALAASPPRPAAGSSPSVAVASAHRRYWPSLFAAAHAETLRLPIAARPAASAHKVAPVVAAHAGRTFVQVGAFAVPKNAERVRARIAVFGSTAIVPARINGAALYRVRLGPTASKAAARRLLSKIVSRLSDGAAGRQVIRHDGRSVRREREVRGL
jgi:rare lipoprotein A